MDRTLLTILNLLPKNLISRFIGFFANLPMSKTLIPWFAKRYNINLEEAEKDISEYPCLNQFFTRHLKAGVRPIHQVDNPLSVVSPVDGKIAQMGEIINGTLIQAKGLDYQLNHLIGSTMEAEAFQDGYYMTIYLAPTDYHRMHHYASGFIKKMRVIPGQLFPVNVLAVNNVRNLFPINERITTYIENKIGQKSAIVKVGATVVGKIKLAYHKAESNKGLAMAKTFETPIEVTKGDELGYFAMGSTVIMLFEKDSFKVQASLKAGDAVQMGQDLGHFIDPNTQKSNSPAK
ncbi:archaetidylserine decarboxylase [Lentisphaera profundi]|uniref:phosphatidylserine decarboxylase n=1 Tax=Lentisphaera profundi TaxID=1658616 RepID=A0ABY7VX97_9BACT|nr:archaetidylserine decarboxylase [Lentisphaera profundi]WDE97898.1 archaetidylserine decarboxylase [Lentisphaera profundi]